MGTVLVTGGAGYIGSHTVRHLRSADWDVVVFDDLSAGHREALPNDVPLVEGDLADRGAIAEAFRVHAPQAVVHFAGSIEAGESMTDPLRFWRNNVVNGVNLLEVLLEFGPIPFVFSSSAAVYGEPEEVPIHEDAPKAPTNVYGETKLAFEQILRALDRSHDLRSISLRYFNACGAHPSGEIGDDHRNKTHLITLALLTALGQRQSIKVFGTDYSTPDGTCIRDYIHVDDLADAHVLALDALRSGAATDAYNVGLGQGSSVQEVLDTVDRVTGSPIPRETAERRAGDPAVLVADPRRIHDELAWAPSHPDLDEMIATAWKWHRRHPHGFNADDTS